MLRVNRYQLSADTWDGSPAPRAWRISTPEGVFWLAEDGGATRLIRLPDPTEQGDEGTGPADRAGATCETLALAAETEAASRWTRANLAGRAGGIGEGQA
jgi:hypothetical protein